MLSNVWYGNSEWPSGRNLGEFAKDVFRLEGSVSDRDKALAFYKWIIRCFMRGPNFTVQNGFGTYSRSFDPLLMFASFGHFECTGFGWIAAEALQAAGLKARRVVGQKDGHTVYEVWYKGENGKEQWHAFDSHMGYWVLNKEGDVASLAEITANPELIQNPVGSSKPFSYNQDMIRSPKRHAWSDALDIIQKVQNETLSYSIKSGQEYANLFEPADPSRILYCGEQYPRGSHCHIGKTDHTGVPLYPENEPYWNNYRHNFHDTSWVGSNKPVRSHGCGAMRWSPLLYGELMAEWFHNAKFENGMVMPTGINKDCQVCYKISVPYYISYLQLEGFVKNGGQDYFGVAISTDGKTFASLGANLTRDFRILNGLEERKNGLASVQYTREFFIAIDMHGHSERTLPILESFRIIVGYQHNMFTQPFLLPGKNNLYLSGEGFDNNITLNAKWNYTVKNRFESETVKLNKDGDSKKELDINCDNIEDIKMNGIVLSCESISSEKQ